MKMASFTQSIKNILGKAGKAFVTYPVVMLNALLFTAVAIARAALGWEAQQPYSFLFNCLQLAFALGAIFSMAAITFAHSKTNTRKSFVLANVLGLVVPALTFFLLYYLGGVLPEKSFYEDLPRMMVSQIASARVGIAIFLSLLTFMLLAAKTAAGLDFSGAFFMTLKAFFIALLYGLVILGGVSAVFSAIQALLFTNLSSKIYEYVAAISGLIGFSIFVGYFPDFRKDSQDPHRETAQKQPKFIAVLFEYILVPIMMALTLVLVLWAIKTISSGMDTPFINLYSIATSFAVGGLLLHILVTHNDSKLAIFYKKGFPFAVLFILMFEAWALIISLNKSGMKTTEYIFIVIWIIAFISAILLILKQERAHPSIVLVISVLAVVAVLPIIGFHDLPFNQQVKRLENILSSEQMLQDDKIVPAKSLPAQATRETITDAVDFLIYAENSGSPVWLDKTGLKLDSFQKTFGFDRVFPDQDPNVNGDYKYTMLYLDPQIIDVSAYQWELTSLQSSEKYFETTSFTGDNGEYAISWSYDGPSGLPNLEITLDGKSILKDNLKSYLDSVVEKYPLASNKSASVTLEDMTYKIEVPEISLTLIFNRVEINTNSEAGDLYYNVGLQAIYLNEK